MKTNKIMLAVLGLAVLCGSCKEEEVQYDASGVFETTDVVVSAKAAGEILSLNVEEGQNVEAGVLLGSIDSKQLALQKQTVLANKAASQSKKQNIAPQVASLEQQIANLRKEEARYKALYRDGAATQKQVADITYQITTLQKQIAAVRDQMATSNSSIDAQNPTFDAQNAQLDDKIAQYRITSPIAGTVLSKYAEPGEYASPGRALFKVADISEMKLRAYITADQLTAVKIGQKVTVLADEGTAGRKEYEGTVSWISTKAEFTPKTIQTRDERANLVYAIKIDVPNPDGLIKRGMYGDVVFK